MTKRVTKPEPPKSEAEKWLEILPAPSRDLLEHPDEDGIAVWLHDVGEVGGIAGLQWAYSPDYFPFGPYLRGRVQHIYGSVFRELEDRSRRKAEQAAAEREAQRRDAHRELLRSKGWRVT